MTVGDKKTLVEDLEDKQISKKVEENTLSEGKKGEKR